MLLQHHHCGTAQPLRLLDLYSLHQHLQGAGKADRKEQLDSVSTQRELYDLLNNRIRTAVTGNRTAKSQLVHVSAVCQWALFCTNLGVSPFRWEWYLRGDLSASQLAKEDGLFALYVSFLSLKTSDKQSVENYLSAVRTFHSNKLFLTPPAMPLTSRLVDLFGKKQLSENPVRRRRDIMTPDEYRAVCSWWDDLAAASESAGDEQAAWINPLPGCDTSILVSQPAKDINSIAPYTYVIPLRPMHMAPPIKKHSPLFLVIRAFSDFHSAV
jgi:hypothetical protein